MQYLSSCVAAKRETGYFAIVEIFGKITQSKIAINRSEQTTIEMRYIIWMHVFRNLT